MSAQHTPGPWEVRKHRFEGLCVHAPTIEAQSHCTYMVVRDVNGDETADPTYGTPDANASLIAAAPDLLALAREIADNAILAGMEIGQRAREVIAKATGEHTDEAHYVEGLKR